MTTRLRFTDVGLTLLAALLVMGYTPLWGQESARAQVERANAQELKAIMEGDAARAASYFVEDALLLPPDGSIVRGRAAIERYWTPAPGTRITDAQTETVRFEVDGRHATLVGTYTLSVQSGSTSTTYAGTFFMVWRRTSATEWRIVVDAWTSREATPAGP